MIEVRTLLKRGEAFVDVEDFAGVLADPDYIEGAIELSIDRRPLLTRELWDDVNYLWAYLVPCLLQLQAGETASTFFPDQPIQITLTPEAHGQRVRFLLQGKDLGRVEVSTHRESFVRAMAREARRFFERMQLLAPLFEPELESLLALEETLKP